jgi:hypothetical protein
MLTEAGAIDVLARRGFARNLSVVADHLRSVETGRCRSRERARHRLQLRLAARRWPLAS